jgi:hypothetical protein
MIDPACSSFRAPLRLFLVECVTYHTLGSQSSAARVVVVTRRDETRRVHGRMYRITIVILVILAQCLLLNLNGFQRFANEFNYGDLLATSLILCNLLLSV